MADVKPLKLVDQGGGAGRLEEFGAGDRVPAENLPATEWAAETVSQAEAEAGTATTRRAWTAQRVAQAVRGAVLTGLSTTTASVIAATDSVLSAMGKLQAQIADLTTSKLDANANAVSASKLQTARTIELAGDVTGSGTFDGTGDLIIHTIGGGGGGSAGVSFLKANSFMPAWAKSGSALVTAQVLAYTSGGESHELPAGTAVILPALTAGNDYAIYATVDGRLVADLNWTAPSGEPAGSTRKVGGFHVSLTGEIFEFSLWDINYRPSCHDPRGMVCINGMFWADIYLLGVNHHIDGTSRAGVVIADGASPPKIPAIFGGNGSTAYGSLTWFEAQDVLQSHGKRCPSWAEFSMLAFGVTEQTSVGTDPVTTKHDAPRRSRWGVEQATGNLWVWGAEVQGNAGGGWAAITGGRGSVYHSAATAVLLGAAWVHGASSGSRAAHWNNSPGSSSGDFGVRGLSDHLCLLAER